MKWTDEEHNHLIELIQTRGTKWKLITQLMSERFKKEFGYDQIRARYRMNSDKVESIEYRETNEILADGSHKSDKLLRMSAEQLKDTAFLLKGHGYDPNKWEIVNAKSSIWNQHNKQDGTITLYSSKITVKPIANGFDWSNLLKKIETIPSKNVEPKYIRDIDYLSIPLFDMHFGISTYENYKPTQQLILGLIQQGYKEVLIIVGQDMLHNDNFKGQTANGTPIDKVDMELAWEEAMLFYIPIIDLALEKCKKVKIMYSKGNHDESMSWAFVQCLKTRFPQTDVDTRYKERKVHMLGLNFIGVNHGDKKKEINLNENFSTEFPFEWSRATTREIFTGHLHHERVIDKGGTVIRRMPTANEIDDYHDERGYTTAHKRFQVFEYSEDAMKRIHYV